MKHIPDIELIEFVAGRLADAHGKALQAHVDRCPQCAERLREYGQTWRVLGAWQVPVDRPLRTAGEFQAASQGLPPATWRLWRQDVYAALRMAAAVTMVAAAGYGAGRWTARPKADPTQINAPAYLWVLGGGSAGPLSQLILDEESALRGES